MAGRERVALRRLIQRWREEAVIEGRRLNQFHYGGARDGEMPDDEVMVAHARNGMKRLCADQLEAALGGVGAGRIAEERETENDDDQSRGDSTGG